MFGYINANREILDQENRDLYQNYYCGLCQQLKKDAGSRGQMLLNYDCAFLAVLLSGLYELDHDDLDYHCMIHPGKKRICYENAAVEYASAMDIVLSYQNLLDDYHDSGKGARKALAEKLRPDYERVGAVYPRQVNAVEACMKELAQAEAAHESNLDMVAGLTGQMLGEIFVWKEDIWARDLRDMGFYMGKFIYIMDAYEDRPKDLKSGNYNPLVYQQFGSEEEYETILQAALNTQMGECAKAFERLPILENTEVLRNVLYSGVWTKYEYLRKKNAKKK